MVSAQRRLWFIVGLGLFLRYTFRFSSYYEEIAQRVEVSSPVSAWIRVVEGVTLKRLNISAYSGDTFHESPIFLKFYEFLVNFLTATQIGIFFIIIDLATAFVLAKVGYEQLKSTIFIDQKRIETNLKDHDDKKLCDNLLIALDSATSCAEWIVAIHLLSPYSILPCVGQSTTVLGNFLISLIFLTATRGHRATCLLLLSLSAVNSFYTLILLLPVILVLEQSFLLKHSKNSSKTIINSIEFDQATRQSIILSLVLFSIFSILLLTISWWLENFTFRFLYSNYVYVWIVSDLTPNIGLFWYFFSEMFEHFRTFFLWVFQLNFFIYIIPLTTKLYHNPYILCLVALINHSILKPYPTVADFALYLTLLPQWTHLFEFMKSVLVVSGTIVTTSVLAPVLWYLWIVLGTANSNFYFGITLAFNVGQILLITDLIFAHVKREFYINNLQLYTISKKSGKSPKIELSFK